MADATKRILFEAVLDDKGVLTGFKQIKEQMDQVKGSAITTAPEVQGLSGAMGALGISMATLAGTTGFLAVVRGMKDITSAFAEAEVSAVRLGAVVRATGEAAGYSTEQALEMAAAMQRLTGVSHETVEGAETVLLTFRNIGHDAFPQALKASADLAAVMGTDMSSAARALGMALENPEQGMMRLRRAGILLSEAVKNTIKDLWEQGRNLEAQNILLAEVQRRVGGAAEALGTTFTGSLNKVREAWRDVKEEMGGFLAASEEGKGTLQDLATVLGIVATKLKEIRDLPGATAGSQAGISFVSALLGSTPFGPALAQLQQIQILLGGIAAIAPGAIAPGLVSSHNESFVSGGTLDAEAAWKKIEEAIRGAIKAQDKYLEGESKVTEASFEIMKSVGTLMTETFADELSARFAAGGEFRLKTDRAFSDFARYAGKNIGLVMGTAAGDEFSDAMWEAARENATAGRFADVADYFGGPRTATKAGKEFSLNFGNAFREGFLTIFQGEGMVNAWKAIAQGFAGIFAQSMGNMLTALFQGKNLSEVGQAGGLWTPGKEGEQGTFNWEGAAGMFGGGLASYGMARQNRMLATAGSAITGAGAGAALGAQTGLVVGWVGALIGAVVGGLLGYFSSGGPKQYGFNIDMSRRVGGAPFVEMGGGTGPIQEREMGRQLQTRYEEITGSFRDLLDKMNVSFDKLPLILEKWVGKSADLNATFQAILKGELPRAIAQAYLPLLQTGMTGLGVSGGRATYELGKLMTGDFDKALAGLKAYIEAVIRLSDLHEDLAKSLDELRIDLTASIHDAWKITADKSLEEITRLSEGLDSLTSEEQVARANQIADITEAQYKANLQYLQQLYQAQQQISDSFKETFLGFEEQRAKTGGPESLGAFYQRQLASLAEQMKTAGSPEMLQQITQQMLKYGQALWQLNLPGQGANTPWGEEAPGSQTWVEQFLKDQQAAADALLKGWQEEVKAQNDTLLAALGAITDALTGELVLREGIKNSLGDEAVIRQHLKGVLDQETDAHKALTNAALAAADALAAIGGGGGVEPGARRAA